jgi:cephalosporin hydroxylase
MLHGTRPDVIIEIGTAYGGGTLFLAHLCDLLGKGRIIGLDFSHKNVLKM